VQARLGILAVDGAPYQNLAKELLAQAAFRSGDIATARTGFTYLSNAPGVAKGIQSRAAQALALINVDHALPLPPLPNLDLITDTETILPKQELPELEIPAPELETPQDQQE